MFVAGHWVPDMVAAAGGIDVAAASGDHSRIVTWDEIMELDAEAVIVALCGFDEARAARLMQEELPSGVRQWLDARRVGIIDGNAYTSRPGPRLIDGIECMAEIVCAR